MDARRWAWAQSSAIIIRPITPLPSTQVIKFHDTFVEPLMSLDRPIPLHSDKDPVALVGKNDEVPHTLEQSAHTARTKRLAFVHSAVRECAGACHMCRWRGRAAGHRRAAASRAAALGQQVVANMNKLLGGPTCCGQPVRLRLGSCLEMARRLGSATFDAALQVRGGRVGRSKRADPDLCDTHTV
jgi:hypothetical protein